MRLVAALVLLSAGGVARADDVGFVTLDRLSGVTQLGPSAAYFSTNNGQWTRLDAHGELVAKNGLGGYFQLPLVIESDTGGTSNAALGGLEVGALYSYTGGAIFHLGVVLPTAATMLDSTLLPAMIVRPGDYAQFIPNTTTVRGGFAFELRSCQLFGRLEAGVDVPVLTDDSGFTTYPSWLFHANVAIGFDADHFTVTLESSNVFLNGDVTSNFEALGAALRFRTQGPLRPYIAAVVPLDLTSNEPKAVFVGGFDIRLD